MGHISPHAQPFGSWHCLSLEMHESPHAQPVVQRLQQLSGDGEAGAGRGVLGGFVGGVGDPVGAAVLDRPSHLGAVTLMEYTQVFGSVTAA